MQTSNTVDWDGLKKEFEYIPSDSVAVIRKGNSLRWEPVFLHAATNEAFLKDNGWTLVREVRGFERFEKVKVPTKPLYDPLTKQTYQVPK